MKIYFENCGQYITAECNGMVLIRCDFDLTDCREDESLDGFVARHGGEESTMQYLRLAYTAA